MKCLLLRNILVLCVLFMSLAACGGDDNGTSNTTTNNSPSSPQSPPPPPVPPGVPAISVQKTTSFTASPVRVFFSLANFTIGPPGTPHLQFSVDGGDFNDFYVGTGNDPEVGVQLRGVHTHFAHWISSNSFNLFGLEAGAHSVEFVLVDGTDRPLPNPEAKVTYNFTVQQPPPGNLGLQPVLSGLDFPVSLVEAPDKRIFFNERLTGRIRIINPNWQLDPTPFCSVSIRTAGEQGLLGLALDPAFSSSNETVYVYYTGTDSVNRVVRLRKSGGVCTSTVILDNLPTNGNHNGGIITFGPDGKLYIVIGDAEVPSDAQDLNSLAGKILRVNTDGSAASGNPFSSSANANARKVYSLGHRNSFGLTFHPSTGQLWESENGTSSDDEVNRIVAGGNYGWPIVGGIANNPTYRNPIVEFTPVIAPTGIVGIPTDSSVYPSPFRGNLLVAEFKGGTIRLVTPNGANPDLPGTSTVAYPGGLGGLLSLLGASDGYVYASSGDRIFRVTVTANPH